LERIQRAQDDLHQLYEEVRSYAAPMNISPQPCDAREVLTEAWDQLAIVRQSRAATLTINPPEFDTCCTVDRSAIRRVFRNIIENSLDACRVPVEIHVELSRTTLGSQSALCVTLCDNGPGFTDQQRERLFEPFFTTKTHGTGLGMAICKRIVAAHGGRIETGTGPGAVIVITLPHSSQTASAKYPA
jgi:signal transduction histidine kinase